MCFRISIIISIIYCKKFGWSGKTPTKNSYMKFRLVRQRLCLGVGGFINQPITESLSQLKKNIFLLDATYYGTGLVMSGLVVSRFCSNVNF